MFLNSQTLERSWDTPERSWHTLEPFLGWLFAALGALLVANRAVLVALAGTKIAPDRSKFKQNKRLNTLCYSSNALFRSNMLFPRSLRNITGKQPFLSSRWDQQCTKILFGLSVTALWPPRAASWNARGRIWDALRRSYPSRGAVGALLAALSFRPLTSLHFSSLFLVPSWLPRGLHFGPFWAPKLT